MTTPDDYSPDGSPMSPMHPVSAVSATCSG